MAEPGRRTRLAARVLLAWSPGALLASGRAEAGPQASLGVIAGGAAEDVRGHSPASGAFFLGGRADVLWLASGPGQMAAGPYVDVSTLGFANVNAGGGAEWALPLSSDLPLIVGTGGFLRAGSQRGLAAGMEGSVFFGSRSYNFHSWYGLAAGVFLQTLWLPAFPSSVDVAAGVQIDAEILALPFLLAYEAIAH